MSKIYRDIRLFTNFIENLANYSPKDYDEGLGTLYERFMLSRYFDKLIGKTKINNVLEGPGDGITGIRGINSLIFAINDIEVTYFTPCRRDAEIVTLSWKIIERSLGKKLKVNIKLWDMSRGFKFPFSNDAFDLVWNFCIIEHFSRPEFIIREMSRVSRKYLLVMTQNVWNIGTIPHVVYHLFTGKPWDHGNPRNMRITLLEKLFKMARINILEKGVIDVPVWPDTWNVPLRGIIKVFLNEWRWTVLNDFTLKTYEEKLKKYMVLEASSKIPRYIKLLWAHHLYCYGIKE
jgi:SAM-dependent methyltransferase